jgi:hypothetical protein
MRNEIMLVQLLLRRPGRLRITCVANAFSHSNNANGKRQLHEIIETA